MAEPSLKWSPVYWRAVDLPALATQTQIKFLWPAVDTWTNKSILLFLTLIDA